MKAYLGAAIFSSAWAVDSTSPTSSTSSTKPPNILFIISDELGWNDVSFHGSQQIPTPTLDALATQNRSAILDQYYLQPVCSPTRATIMTGRHVIHTGVYDPMNGGTGDLCLLCLLRVHGVLRLAAGGDGVANPSRAAEGHCHSSVPGQRPLQRRPERA